MPEDHDTPLISVIVPLFDVEDHVAACIASLRAQSGVRFEAIVIDDGSTDATHARAEAAIANDPRFRLIRQDNRGLSGARNAGLDLASGDLVAFVDGDDRVAPDFLWQMSRELHASGADWIACAIRFRHDDPDSPGHGTAHSAIHGAADPAGHAGPRVWPLDDWRDVARHFPSAWNKLYRRSLIDGLRFPEGTWFEDHGFYWRAAARSRAIAHLPQPLYIQTRGRAGQITAQDDDRVDDQFAVLDDLHAVIAAGGKSHGAEAFANIASRLLFERTTALHDPARRARYAARAAAYLRDRGLGYSTGWDRDVARSFALEMAGELPLSVVVAWDGAGDLAASLAALAHQHGPGREILVICDGARAAEAARIAAPHPEARVVTRTGRRGGAAAARDLGLTEARGRYVQFLEAGDTMLPGALQATVDAMLSSGAFLGLMPWRDGDGVTRFPFVEEPIHDPPADADLIALRPLRSSMILDRGFLRDRGLRFGTGVRGAWRMALLAAHHGPAPVHLGGPGFVRASAPPSPRPPSAVRLVRGHDALVRALPPDLTRAFPSGWRRRFFLRALGAELDRAPQDLPRGARARFVAGLLAAVLRRGLGGTGAEPAGTDPGTHPRLIGLLDTATTIRALRTRWADTLDALLDLDRAPPGNVDPMIRVPGRRGVTLRFVARLDGAVSYANLGLLDAEGRDVLFHLSLQGDAGRIALNDRTRGVWGDPLHLPAAFGNGPLAVAIDISGGRLSVALDGREVCAFEDGTGTGGRGFEGLDRIAMADPAGGIDMATFRASPWRDPAPSGRLILDDRLTLRGIVPDTAQPLTLEIDGGDDAPPLIARPAQTGLEIDTALPGRLWRGRDAIRLRVVDARGRDAVTPLTVTRADLLARVRAALSDPTLRGDPEAAMLVTEHVRFAALEPDLPPRAQAGLADLAAFYRLEDFLARAETRGEPPPRLLIAPYPETALLDGAVARLTQGLRADPPADAVALLRETVLPARLMPVFLLTLSEAFTAGGRDPAPLLDAARICGIARFDRLDNPWFASAALPFLLDMGAWDDLDRVLETLTEPTPGWIMTAPLAWTLERALGRDDLEDTVRDRIVAAFVSFTEQRAANYWDRTHCQRLTEAAAALVRARPSDDIAQWAVATYGLAAQFWDALGPAPARLRDARAAWDVVQAETAAPDAVEAALRIFADNPDVARWRRARLGPAETADPDRATPTALLRHMAHPGTAPVADPSRAAAALPLLHPDTAPAPAGPSGPHDTLVVVISCQAHLDSRIPALRAGWLDRLAARGIPHVVVVGGGDGTRTGDVVHLDAPDDYEGLPQKTLAAIAWVRDTTRHTHMMKIDDDCFLNVDAVFDDPVHARLDYHGRRLTRVPGQLDRTWHMAKSGSDRGRFELDRSPEPSIYADGGSGYALSRAAMDAICDAAAAPEGRALVAASFMEDKLVGDLLGLRGIGLSDAGWSVTVRRRPHADAIPVPAWQNGFDASAAWPVKLVHLDTPDAQEPARARLSSPVIAPAKIWPQHQGIRLGYNSNALELVSPAARLEAVRDAPVAVVAAMRNEMFMIGHFLDHYRRLGVEAFAIADNLSDDGTLEYLAAQPDVAVFSVDTDYGASHYGVAWQEALMSAFRPGRWSLVADADEFLVWQDPQEQSLAELLEGPDFADADAARIFMLDMYPEGPLSGADFRAAGPFAQAGFCETHPFLLDNPGQGPFSDRPTWTSALRHRLIPGSRPQLFVAQKYALLRYGPQMRFSDGLHYVARTRLARRELLFAHFKYNADFRRKARAEVARRQHFNDAEEYRRYLALASEGRDTVHEDGISVRWQDSPFVRARLG